MIQIRSCAGFDEMEACVQLQIETWGYDENDVIPRKTFLLAQKIGGQVIGAFDSELATGQDAASAEALVGFAMSLPGIKDTKNGPLPYIHSHMLAVAESHRNRGLGAQLKWEQRREALSRGIRHMEWTFDPLEIKNAFLNIHRLGAIAREYREDFYGVSSSRLQGGLPTDRLLAEWELDSPRVKAIFDWPPGSTLRDRRTHSGSGLHRPVEGRRSKPEAGPRCSVGESAEVSTGIFPGIGGTWFLPGCGRKRSLRTGFPRLAEEP